MKHCTGTGILGVERLSRMLGVSRSSYYAGSTEPPACSREDERIKAAHARSRETYGSRRLQVELASKGFVAGRNS